MRNNSILFNSIKKLNQLTPFLLVLAGIGLSGLQFIYNRSLWGDEAMLAINIVQTDFSSLHLPLQYAQVGPLLYLYLLKLGYLIYPGSEMSLRILPLLGYWISIFLFYKVLQQVFREKYLLQTFGLSLLVFNTFLIYYSSEVKHYELDMLVASFFLYAPVNRLFDEARGKIYLTLSCIVAIGISGNAPVFLPGVFLYLALENKSFIQGVKALFVPGIAIVMVFAAYYFLFLNAFKEKEFMDTYWSVKEPSFMPLNPFSAEFSDFVYSKQLMLFEYVFRFGVGFGWLFKVLFLAGIIFIFKSKSWKWASLFLVPILLHLMISGLHIYPFHIRFCLYLIPGLIVLFLYGAEFIAGLFKRPLTLSKLPHALVPALLFLFFLNFKLTGFPLPKQEVRRCYRLLEEQAQPGDLVFLHFHQKPQWDYYTQTGIITSPAGTDIQLWYEDEELISQLDSPTKLQGKVWIFFNALSPNEHDDLFQKLNELGWVQQSQDIQFGSYSFCFIRQ
jgi:hypothetical protein